jgi:hypothetical protein
MLPGLMQTLLGKVGRFSWEKAKAAPAGSRFRSSVRVEVVHTASIAALVVTCSFLLPSFEIERNASTP